MKNNQSKLSAKVDRIAEIPRVSYTKEELCEEYFYHLTPQSRKNQLAEEIGFDYLTQYSELRQLFRRVSKLEKKAVIEAYLLIIILASSVLNLLFYFL